VTASTGSPPALKPAADGGPRPAIVPPRLDDRSYDDLVASLLE